jgi:hypothetical protein
VPAPVVVLSIPGLTLPALAGTTALRRVGDAGVARSLRPVLPALPGPMQEALTRGAGPERLWARVRRSRPGLKVAVLFPEPSQDWDADFVLAPTAGVGGERAGVVGEPAGLYSALVERLGREFPAVNYSGPLANIESSRWIIEAAGAVHEFHHPDLLWVNIPHLSFGLQRWGPGSPAAAADLSGVDDLLSPLLERLISSGAAVVITGEYGVRSVSSAVFPNRALREAGPLRVREDKTRELVVEDSDAVAVVDHQVAHIYCRTSEDVAAARAVLEQLPGVAQVATASELGVSELGSAARDTHLIALAEPDRWFAYYWWLEDGKAPAFARSVGDPRKPGVDPMELFINPRTKAIDLNTARVKGSFGLVGDGPGDRPVFTTNRKVEAGPASEPIAARSAAGMIESMLL